MTSIAHPERAIPREALAAAGVAATLAAALAWFGPPGSDFAAHLYQSALFEDHGFEIWNNFWYAGRYSFVTYSLLYYPLAALLGIKLLAVASVATAALAFGVVAAREWGPASRWSNRSFAVVWAGVVLSGAFPFALGIALALLALWALQAGRRGRFALLTVLVLAASPVAFVLLGVILAGIGLSRTPRRAELALPLATLAAATVLELAVAAPLPGRRPLPVLAARVRGRLRVLWPRDPAHLACGDGRSAPLDVRRLPRGLHRRVPRALEPRREHRAAALRGDPDRDPDPLPAALAAAARRRLRALARGRVEPHARSPAASSRRAPTRRPTRPTGPRRCSSSAGISPRPTASRRSTPSATGPPPTSRPRASRSPVAGSGRTTSRATACSTPSSTGPGTWPGSARSASATSSCPTPRSTTAPRRRAP